MEGPGSDQESRRGNHRQKLNLPRPTLEMNRPLFALIPLWKKDTTLRSQTSCVKFVSSEVRVLYTFTDTVPSFWTTFWKDLTPRRGRTQVSSVKGCSNDWTLLRVDSLGFSSNREDLTMTKRKTSLRTVGFNNSSTSRKLPDKIAHPRYNYCSPSTHTGS